MIDYADANRKAWDHESEQGNIWTDGCTPKEIEAARKGDVHCILTPFKEVPPSWLGDLREKKILCLASGGGQQGVLLSAAGAQVTVFDISEKQIAQDKKIAELENLPLKTIQGDMRDLSRFPDEAFDLIYNPTSTCFIDDVISVYAQCNRILKTGGYLLTSAINPILYMFEEQAEKKGKLKIKYTIPYSDPKSLSRKQLEKHLQKYDTIEFSHTLESLLGGLCENGFSITGMYSDSSGCEILDSFVHDCFLAIKAKKNTQTTF
ncbi:class I SAM-dependent methyltransferase [uncultured Sphaerochaeta sp.]|uniref:class I SAM-dependent methyltransferase n=1 Tax=uncultured Sphaerochaeta sp. TaxID=886478 RepID=UPI002A0A3F04|nr:class I SAM-dependent methyltransferase [uncultured Sphaerochaeta sp.]